ncbi:hemicentin-1-like [Gigantopelta aegis]|uniref:hemicentin-1-like n=1 Tax=Gigantopelta aegis TaxID=1735272 RepID=UPI001B887B14|nr:hemicentin-1-like [Gigantopelta aegis]XP_041370879.1 hemicentin-1-like [Gigantopelta aegis]XP_041370880.1 hemicentin-1-like [Gigantopelta aegis]XP_041370881.1 hemicentin-1-like [Gigantopelta aegis]XP_041370883.1 hemicentin-1-like [Gigantopelta aegis]
MAALCSCFRDTRWRCSTGIYIFIWITSLALQTVKAGSGCADGTRDGLENHEWIAACMGRWMGHISNSSSLCSPGWRVCSWYDEEYLHNIKWKEAVSVAGCYAYNAAQDGGRCRECRNDMEQDDLAGLGHGCSNIHQGQTSCISGGRIDASCCVDAHFHRACQYQPGIATGVLCCKMPVKRPRIAVKPPEKMHVYTGLIFLLTCQATGMPPPRVQWYKDGVQMSSDNPRISVLSSGDLLVTLARKSDTGLYTCEVINEEGIDMASSYVMVAEYSSGCKDGSTEGLHLHRDIHACAGKWKGHVRHGKALCRRGWRVCNPRDRSILREVTWLDIFDLEGCYAYNAANSRGRCKKCTKGKMAGIGQHCGFLRYSQTSCLSQGRIDAYHPKNKTACVFQDGHISGVVCCKKKKKNKSRAKKCSPDCENGGECVAPNRCHCTIGYKGARCQNPICTPSCGSKGVCIRPNKCKCSAGYGGRYCRRKVLKCKKACLNGGRCVRGKCRCRSSHWGSSCQYLLQHILLSRLNRTER